MSARGSPISAARYADADATADALPPPSLAALLRTARTRLADREELCRSLRAKLSEAQHALCQHQVSTSELEVVELEDCSAAVPRTLAKTCQEGATRHKGAIPIHCVTHERRKT